VVTTTAGKDSIGIKKTFLGNHWIDKISIQVAKEIDPDSFTYNFAPDGSDERQYSSPEFRIPTISITNSKYHEYDEYHTSADNLEYISIDNFKKNLLAHIQTINRIEMNVTPRKKTGVNLGGEYQLGKRGLFPNIGGGIYQKVANSKDIEITTEHIDSYGWLMHLIDGKTSVLEISDKSGLEFNLIYESLQIFQSRGLVEFN
jgi:aminopeptidase-like protein